MKTLIKTLALLTAGVGAVAVVKRVSEKLETLEHKIDSTSGAVTLSISLAEESKRAAERALENARGKTLNTSEITPGGFYTTLSRRND